MILAVEQYISAPYSHPLTMESVLALVLLVVGGPAFMSIAFYYLSRQKRVSSDDTNLGENSTESIFEE
jgi:hypothetical protein